MKCVKYKWNHTVRNCLLCTHDYSIYNFKTRRYFHRLHILYHIETFLNYIHKKQKCPQNLLTILCFQYFTNSWSMHTGIAAPGLTPTILAAVKRWGRPHWPVASYRISGVLSIGRSIDGSVLKGKQQNYRLPVGVPLLHLGYSHVPYQHQIRQQLKLSSRNNIQEKQLRYDQKPLGVMISSTCKHSTAFWCLFDRASWYRIISSTNFNAQFSLFINNMFVTLLSSTCFEH